MDAPSFIQAPDPERLSRAPVAEATTATIASLAQSEAPKPAAGGPALDGFCPVAYVDLNQAVKGDPKHKSEHQGRTFHFANAQAKQMFDQTPAKYLPAYDGLCATGVSMGMKLPSDPKLFAVRDGRTYLFSDAKAKGMFEQDTKAVIAKADANWPKLKQQK
jgi:YHS domain-containing protein